MSVCLGLAADLPQSQPVIVKGLRCEYLSEPEGIDVRLPRLSWRLESERRGIAQIAAQIRVASSPEKLTRGEANLWDSGRVDSARSNQVVYAGQTLVSRAECFWQVRIWDELNQVSGWSPVARWTMGLLQPSDWTAAWIAQRDHEPLHIDRAKLHLPPPRHFRKEFTEATLNINYN